MIFKDPWILFFIPFVLALILFFAKRTTAATFSFPSKTLLHSLPATWKSRWKYLPQTLRIFVIVLFFFALAGPRSVLEEKISKSEGIDLVLTVDISQSMAAEDFKINGKRKNRLEIVKEVVDEFIERREFDRIGLVTFAGLAYTVCPLTTDYSWLKANLARVNLGLIDDGRTAIGSAIASSLARLRRSDAKSKVIILLTDGVSNAGNVEPIKAAQAAQAYGVRIYTIGAGSKGKVPYPAKDFFGRKVYQQVQLDLDEETLKEIARVADGQYFRATDTESLRQIYKEIDALEKTEIEELGFLQYEERFNILLLWALGLLLAELILSHTTFLRLP